MNNEQTDQVWLVSPMYAVMLLFVALFDPSELGSGLTLLHPHVPGFVPVIAGILGSIIWVIGLMSIIAGTITLLVAYNVKVDPEVQLAATTPSFASTTSIVLISYNCIAAFAAFSGFWFSGLGLLFITTSMILSFNRITQLTSRH